MSGELKNEIENKKEVFLEEIKQVQSQEKFRSIRHQYARGNIIEDEGDFWNIKVPLIRSGDGYR
jgi:hypothetical protein